MQCLCDVVYFDAFDFQLKTQGTALKENLMMFIFVSSKRVDGWLGFPSSMATLNDSMTSRSDFWL